MFDFDHFVNKPCIGLKKDDGSLVEGIFGREVTYQPAQSAADSFTLMGDFHEAYQEIDTKTNEVAVTSYDIALYVRLVDFPQSYQEPLQGDHIYINQKHYQIVDIQHHIPGSRKLLLHEHHTSQTNHPPSTGG